MRKQPVSLGSFDAIFFDAGGTLLHPYPSVGEIYAEVASRYGVHVSAADLEPSFRRVWTERDGMGSLESHSDEEKEKRWWYETVEEVFRSFGGVPRFDEFFCELYDLFARPEAWRLYPGTLDVLKALKKQKVCVAIVSNWDSRLFRLCDEFEITPHVHFILASAVFGAAKPSSKIFDEALRRSGVPAGRAVHIGDSLADDIAGARAVGIHSVLIDRGGHYQKCARERQEPHLIIRDLKELLG